MHDGDQVEAEIDVDMFGALVTSREGSGLAMRPTANADSTLSNKCNKSNIFFVRELKIVAVDLE